MTGEEMRCRRLALGLTQTELGDALNLNRRSVQRFERGKWPVSLKAELALSNLLADKGL